MSKPLEMIKSIAIGIVAANLLGWASYALYFFTCLIWIDNWIRGLSFVTAFIALVVLFVIGIAKDLGIAKDQDD